jgi:hypothetical protein
MSIEERKHTTVRIRWGEVKQTSIFARVGFKQANIPQELFRVSFLEFANLDTFKRYRADRQFCLSFNHKVTSPAPSRPLKCLGVKIEEVGSPIMEGSPAFST